MLHFINYNSQSACRLLSVTMKEINLDQNLVKERSNRHQKQLQFFFCFVFLVRSAIVTKTPTLMLKIPTGSLTN